MQQSPRKPAASLRALLTGAIDYAGLFPPASLPLEPSLRNYAEYLGSAEAWMLGGFVLPTEQFSAAEQHLDLFDEQHPLRVSALGARTKSSDEFTNALANAAREIARLSRAHRQRISIHQLEMPLPPDFDEKLFVAVHSLLDPLNLQIFWEAPATDAERTIHLLAAHNASRAGKPFGFKLRTGGVTADAFPTSMQIAQALVAAATSEVPIKFTAGLHHPVRMFRGEVQTKMHGFLNVLGGGVLSVEERWIPEQAARMLDDEDAHCFHFTDRCFSWRDKEVRTERVAEHRRLITSLGSCSFDEPREDLRALGLL